MINTVALILWAAVTLYAIFGGADFGAGFWDLTAGGAERGRRPRALIDISLGPVWEANHVWLIFSLVILWTGFPPAFGAIMTTLYVPLTIAVLGIVLRGSGFAFLRVSLRTNEKRIFGAVFALSSVIVPFALGVVAGSIASGKVPTNGQGDPIDAWFNLESLVCGLLAVAACAYLGAVFLTASARWLGAEDLEEAFRKRSIGSAVATGAVAAGAMVVFLDNGPNRMERLIGVALPVVILSAVLGLLALYLLTRRREKAARFCAIGAVGSIMAAWGVAQYPYLLGDHLTLAEAAAPSGTLVFMIGVVIVAAFTVVPSLIWLFRLDFQGRLMEIPDTALTKG